MGIPWPEKRVFKMIWHLLILPLRWKGRKKHDGKYRSLVLEEEILKCVLLR